MQHTAEFSVQQPWQSDRRSPARWVASLTWRQRFYLGVVILGAFGNGMGAGLIPIFVGWAFDVIINSLDNPDYTTLGWLTLGLIGTQLMRSLLMLARNAASEVVGQRVEREARIELYLSLIGKSMSFHDSHTAGELMARATNDVREINFMFNPGVNLAIGSAFFIIAPFFLVPTIHPQLLLTIVLYLITYIFLLWDYLRELEPVTEQQRQAFGKMNATLAEAIDGVETVKGTAQEEKEMARFNKASRSWRDAFIAQGDVEAKFLPLLLLGLLQTVALGHSLIMYQQGLITIGDVVAFNTMMLMFGFPTFAAQFAYSRISVGLSSARRVLDIINTETEVNQNQEGYSGQMDGSIVFDNITFDYKTASFSLTNAVSSNAQPTEHSVTTVLAKATLQGGQTTQRNGGPSPTQRDAESPDNHNVALQNVSFTVQPGQTVAITGQTGAGKSTIAKLLNRTYDSQSGRVLVGGQDVRAWNLAALRQQISIIEQDIYLFSRTVAENIAFGQPNATREEVIDAAKAAQAHEFIINFKDSYDTLVGERGVTLSGGQRQRIALARAFLTNPQILVLDDATSAIDSATEDKIERAAQGRTTILITHRLSQIRWADLIIVLRRGRVAMIGTHDELMENSAAYRNIFARYE